MCEPQCNNKQNDKKKNNKIMINKNNIFLNVE